MTTPSDDSFFETLRQIRSSEDTILITKALTLIQAAEDNSVEEDLDEIGTPKDGRHDFFIRSLQQKIAQQAEEITLLREYCDQEIDAFIIDIQKNILDHETAMDAYYSYDSEFFIDLPFTQDGKTKVAAALLNSCAFYMREASNPIWMNVINNKSLNAHEFETSVNVEDKGQAEIVEGPTKDSEA